MENKITTQAENNRIDTELLRVMQETSESNNKDLTSLKMGQKIYGEVVSVREDITLNFDGVNVTSTKEVLKDVKEGEVRLFEVVKVSGREIELKSVEETANTNQTTSGSTIRIIIDQNIIKCQKEQSEISKEREAKFQEIRNTMEQIASILTEQDCQILAEEGFPAEKLTIEGLYSALNRIKRSTSVEGQSVRSQGASYSKLDVAQRLQAENLPVTLDNIQKVNNALELCDITSKINDRTLQHLIANEKEPTIENIYKAYYSGNSQKKELATWLTAEDWSELIPQAEEVIKASGYEVNESNLKEARWLIENKLPLTKQSFRYKKELEEIKVSSNKEEILDKIMEGMKNGALPKDISLQAEDGKAYEQFITDIKGITVETVTKAVKDNTVLTLKNLIELQAVQSPKQTTDGATDIDSPEEFTVDFAYTEEKGHSYEEIKAMRKLEEIRLKMTAEAAARLEKKGIHVETERLEKVVEALREMEDSYYKEMLKESDIAATKQQIQLLKETTQNIEQLKYTPSYVLGLTLEQRPIQTIEGLMKEGCILQKELSRAGEAYETLMTVPNQEYGDSIQKAFQNMGSLLEEMGLENTSLNQRAVRILGYNRMDISPEAVRQVKAYDLEVNQVLKELHPAVTVRMIKEGLNPLDMPLSEINSTIDKIKEEQGITSEEKFSTYLRKLEKEEGITQEERKSYIGIYRLLHTIEKSDGAALGAVLKSDRVITLNSLLTAVRTARKGSIDSVIHDGFGMLDNRIQEGESITEQINAAYNMGEETERVSVINQGVEEEKAGYLKQILKLMKEEIAPDKLHNLRQSELQEAMSKGQDSLASAPLLASSKGIWETVSELPIEMLFDRLQTKKELQQKEDKFYTQKVQEIRELCKNSDQAVRFLNDYQLPGTPANIMLTNHILSNGEIPMKKLLKQQNEKVVEKTENGLKEIEEVSDTLIDKNSMNEMYEELEQKAKTALDQAMSEEIIDSMKLAQRKSTAMQMTFLRTLAEKEFYRIPIETEQGITNMNLTILRGEQVPGRLSATIWSKRLGSMKAELSMKKQTLKGFISCDNREGLELLKENTGAIEQVAMEEGISIKQLDFGTRLRSNDSYSYTGMENEAKQTDGSTEAERILYRMAKALVIWVREAERAGEETDQAAS